MFDSCCFGRVAVDKLIEFLGSGSDNVDFAHLSDFQLQEALDDDWVPQFVEEGWIVISADQGKRPSKGSKLPLLCRRYGVTHVLLSGSVHDLRTFDKARAIAAVWPSLLTLSNAPKGSCHKIQKTVSGGFFLRSPDPQEPTEGPPRQKSLKFPRD